MKPELKRYTYAWRVTRIDVNFLGTKLDDDAPIMYISVVPRDK
jgi:hypothetical protein